MKDETWGEENLLRRLPALVCVQTLLHPLSLPKPLGGQVGRQISLKSLFMEAAWWCPLTQYQSGSNPARPPPFCFPTSQVEEQSSDLKS